MTMTIAKERVNSHSLLLKRIDGAMVLHPYGEKLKGCKVFVVESAACSFYGYTVNQQSTLGPYNYSKPVVVFPEQDQECLERNIQVLLDR